MPKVDLSTVEQTNATGYPPPLNEAVAGRLNRKLGIAFALEDFGVTETTLLPGAWSSQRHWHEAEDELVVMIEGEGILVEEDGETVMRAGDIAIFKKGVANAHHLVNRGDAPCRFIAVGKPASSRCHYPDVDLGLDETGRRFTRKDGSPV